MASDQTYFDPMTEKRIDGQDALKKYMAPFNGAHTGGHGPAIPLTRAVASDVKNSSGLATQTRHPSTDPRRPLYGFN